MKTSRTLLAAAAMAGATLLPATMAGASSNPDLSLWNGTERLVVGGVGGTDVTVRIEGCVDPGSPTYAGVVISMSGDPLAMPDRFRPWEGEVVDGVAELATSLKVGEGDLSYQARWYCSTVPGVELGDPGIVYTSPLLTFDVDDPTPAAPLTADRSARTAAGVSAGDTLSFSLDADALPAVDQIGIRGDVAGALKGRVDDRAAKVARVVRLYNAFLGRTPEAGGLEYWADQVDRGMSPSMLAARFATAAEFRNGRARLSDGAFVDALYRSVLGRPADAEGRDFWTNRLRTGLTGKVAMVTAFAESAENVDRTADLAYVLAAHLELGHRLPGAADLDSAVERLEAGDLKVNVVEDVALSYRSAAAWNRRS